MCENAFIWKASTVPQLLEIVERVVTIELEIAVPPGSRAEQSRVFVTHKVRMTSPKPTVKQRFFNIPKELFESSTLVRLQVCTQFFRSGFWPNLHPKTCFLSHSSKQCHVSLRMQERSLHKHTRPYECQWPTSRHLFYSNNLLACFTNACPINIMSSRRFWGYLFHRTYSCIQ